MFPPHSSPQPVGAHAGGADWTAAECFDRYARVVRRALGVPVSLVTVVEEHRQVFPGASGLAEPLATVRETPLSQSLCSIVVRDREPLVAPDLRHSVLADHGAVTELGIGAYAGWPLLDHAGRVIGSLCAIDDQAREWSSDDLDTLRDLAACCSTELAQHTLRQQATEQVAVARHLVDRGQAFLALSEALAAASSLADAAAAVQRVGTEVLGCRHVAMFLPTRVIEAAEGPAIHDDALVYVRTGDAEWPAAARATSIPVGADNPIADCWRRRRPVVLAGRADQERRYPGTPTEASTGEARAALPLALSDEALGVLALTWHEVHAFDDDDLATLTALARYTAQALERAVLSAGRARASETLQRAMLTELPAAGPLELAARYLPAGALEAVGGDWYDAFALPDGGTAVAVGDVVGHDIRAAADMSQLRNILRGLAWGTTDSPASVVARLDRALPDLGVEVLATLVFAHVHGHTLRWTNAGHLPPLLVDPDGDVRWLDDGVPDVMLGAQRRAARTDREVRVEPGGTLLLCTDGLVERRGEDIDAGLARLAESVRARHRCAVGDLLDGVLADLVPAHRADDVAILAVRFPAS